MPIIDTDRASALDKIHSKRMSHAFAQLAVALIALGDAKVNRILANKGITVWPGPIVGIEYGPGDRQVLEVELKAAKRKAALDAKPKAKKSKAKR